MRNQAEVVTIEQEDMLSAKSLLGDGSPQVLLDTLVFISTYISLSMGESISSFIIGHLSFN